MYSRGKFGIEYTPSEPKPESPWLGRVMLIVALVVVALVARAIWTRIKTRAPSDRTAELVTPPAAGNQQPTAGLRPPATSNQQPTTSNQQPATTFREADYANRPVKVRNLMLRLAEAERKRDVEMQISTIEQLRDVSGAADLDDMLARKVGALNFMRLFDLKSAQWTTEVKVKRGDSATRIAFEHGSTLASLTKLNGDKIGTLQVGQVLKVMNHPRFNLVVTRRSRTADLSLNGKFFKRYYLTAEVKGKDGSYETPASFRSFCAEQGIPFKPLDRAELEMLLPKGTAAFIKEI